MEAFDSIGRMWRTYVAAVSDFATFDGGSVHDLDADAEFELDAGTVQMTVGAKVGEAPLPGETVDERIGALVTSYGIRASRCYRNVDGQSPFRSMAAGMKRLWIAAGATGAVVGSRPQGSWLGTPPCNLSHEAVSYTAATGVEIAITHPIIQMTESPPRNFTQAEFERFEMAFEAAQPVYLYLETEDIAAIHDAAETISAESALALKDHKGRAIVAGGPGEAIELPPREPSVANALTRLAHALSSVTGAREYSTESFHATANIIRSRGKK